MNTFQKSNFLTVGNMVYYDGNFIARFKHSKRDRTHFINFLSANFTPNEYQDLLDQGYTPVGALETKGYVSTTVQRILTDHGYAPTQEGRAQYLADQRTRLAA